MELEKETCDEETESEKENDDANMLMDAMRTYAINDADTKRKGEVQVFVFPR